MEAVADSAEKAVQFATVPKFPFLVAAYVAFFLILFVYVWSLHTRQKRVEEKVAALEKRVS